MPVTRRLLREDITYSQAKQKETNVLHQLGYYPQQTEFFQSIRARLSLVQVVVGHHLGLGANSCHAADWDEWMHGSFNLCVPVSVPGSRRVLIRFPLPYRVGEGPCPGNADEKVRCEAGTYAWMRQECPTIPIPHLYGFALSTGQCFTALEHLSWFRRWTHRLRLWYLSLFTSMKPSGFVSHPCTASGDLGAYLLLDYVEEGEPLSRTWNERRTDDKLRKNLFRGLSKILLALSRTPLAQIGSFVIDNNGFLQLANRPLTLMLQDLENEHIHIPIPRRQTFSSVDSYVNALLACHDSRMKLQPNAAMGPGDCVKQMTALSLMRTVAHHHFEPSLNHGPFVFCLTDLYPWNILVDGNWNIKCILDLEWAASLPIEFMRPPEWLTNQAVDVIDTDSYDILRKEFMEAFEDEEQQAPARYDLRRASVMNNGWKNRTFWYTLALESPTGLHPLFYDRIQPPYCTSHSDQTAFYITVCYYWTHNAFDFVDAKVRDKNIYDERLRAEFGIKDDNITPSFEAY